MTNLTRGTLLALVLLPTALAAQADIASYKPTADRLIQTALSDSSAYDRLGRLVDTYGHRLSGSKSLEQAIDWIVAEMKKDGLANVRTEPVKVPHWVRGKESVELVSPRPLALSMLGLGGSVGTPKAGITAPVLVVSSFEELEARKAEAKGKIVLFDAPYTTYGETGRYRRTGPVAAARAGAVGVLIRSVGPYGIQTPHTGSTTYDSTVRKIPAAALSMEHSMMLARMQKRGEKVTVRMKMEAMSLPDAISRNVMGEIVGSEFPDEIVVMGGHIDSWDVGQGAMDDAGGVVAAWEALKLMQRLGLKPKRTIRVVGWTNEENGFRGATTYADNLGPNVAKHVFAIESDAGTFRPTGFGFTGSDAALQILRQVGALLQPINADKINVGGGGADIAPLMRQGVPGAGLEVEGERYFWYHHTDGDTLDKLDPADFARCVAAFAVLAYVVADLPEPLPR